MGVRPADGVSFRLSLHAEEQNKIESSHRPRAREKRRQMRSGAQRVPGGQKDQTGDSISGSRHCKDPRLDSLDWQTGRRAGSRWAG